MPTTVFCQLCGRETDHQAKLLRHPDWPAGRHLRVCPDCFQNRPRCTRCGLPLQMATPSGTCPTCEKRLVLCLACGKAVGSRYVEIDGAGPFCENCFRTRPACDVCSAPLTDQHWKLSDGRVSCDTCHKTAVYLPEEAGQIYEELKTVIAARLGISLNIPTAVGLVDRNQLAEIIAKQQNETEEIDPQRTLGVYARQGIRRGIYVQTGLPRKLFAQVVAHEYAHAWQGENCPLLHNPLIREGFAEWLAYKMLEYYSQPRQQERMRARNDVYGQGLKWALDVENQHGPGGLLDACRAAR